MSSSVGTDPSRWVLPTAGTNYVVSMAADRSGLVLDHWGAGLPDQGWRPPERYHFETPADVTPLEYAALGTRQVRDAELIVDLGDGLVGARLSCDEEPVFVDDGRLARLTTSLSDSTGRLSVSTVVETSRDHDVVRKWAVITNLGSDQPVELTRAFSGAWQLDVGPGAHIDYLAGAWSREFTRHRLDLGAGELRIGSRQGITSHSFAPVVTVSPLGAAEQGRTYGLALAWSGSWRMVVDAFPFASRVRVAAGVDDESAVITLAPGQSFTTPVMLGVSSSAGTNGVRAAWHSYQRGVLARSNGVEHRPIVYNSW